MSSYVLVRGGGDLASGVALRLHRTGVHVLVTELPKPQVVRRAVSFAQAVFGGTCRVEEVEGRLISDGSEIQEIWDHNAVPVIPDPQAHILSILPPAAIVDGRMTKQPHPSGQEKGPMVIGLGPGFTAGRDCDAVVETQRGHRLGRVIWEGFAAPDTGIPEAIQGVAEERVLRAPTAGTFVSRADMGDILKAGEVFASVDGIELHAPFDGLVRGLLYPGLEVMKGQKVGDLDPRGEAVDWRLVSDKALAIGGGVLEALLSRPEIRRALWDRN